MGECDEEQSFELLDFFYSQGGNFIDTANNYQQGDSERIIGKWMKERGNRSEIVLATKYGSAWRSHQEREIIQSNFGGLNIKALKHSVEDSLTKLQTDYIDVLYVHWWDHSVGIPELMHALNDLVVKGKVLYLGVSNTPAWIVVKCNAYAEAHNLRQFSIFQGRWNASQREFERDIIPMARSEGMALAPWGVFGQGIFKTKDQKEASQAEGGRQPFVGATKDDEMVTEKLEEMAKRKRVSLQAVALAYVWHKTPYVFPVVGGRKVEHMKSNIEALGAHLSREEIDEIDMATGKPYDLGYPHTVSPLQRPDENMLMNIRLWRCQRRRMLLVTSRRTTTLATLYSGRAMRCRGLSRSRTGCIRSHWRFSGS